MDIEHGVNSTTYWDERYSQNNIGWHIDDIHPILLRHIGLLTRIEKGESKRIFVPLCGKTRDIAYLLSLGHRVFALEFLLQPVLELAAENSFNFKYNPEESVYYTEDERLTVYHGDLFKCPIEKYGPFDCVWDRGSFIALDYDMREAYVDVLKRSLQNADKTYHQFKYLLQSVMYDKTKFKGPPYSVLAEDMERFYGSWADVELVDKLPIGPESPMRKVSGDMPPGAYEVAYMIRPKSL